MCVCSRYFIMLNSLMCMFLQRTIYNFSLSWQILEMSNGHAFIFYNAWITKDSQKCSQTICHSIWQWLHHGMWLPYRISCAGVHCNMGCCIFSLANFCEPLVSLALLIYIHVTKTHCIDLITQKLWEQTHTYMPKVSTKITWYVNTRL